MAAQLGLFHVDQIKASLLVVHGQLDDRVHIEHYRRLTSELAKKSKTCEAMVKEHEGYGVNAEANQAELYESIEEFLEKYLSEGTSSK